MHAIASVGNGPSPGVRLARLWGQAGLPLTFLPETVGQIDLSTGDNEGLPGWFPIYLPFARTRGLRGHRKIICLTQSELLVKPCLQIGGTPARRPPRAIGRRVRNIQLLDSIFSRPSDAEGGQKAHQRQAHGHHVKCSSHIGPIWG